MSKSPKVTFSSTIFFFYEGRCDWNVTALFRVEIKKEAAQTNQQFLVDLLFFSSSSLLLLFFLTFHLSLLNPNSKFNFNPSFFHGSTVRFLSAATVHSQPTGYLYSTNRITASPPFLFPLAPHSPPFRRFQTPVPVDLDLDRGVRVSVSVSHHEVLIATPLNRPTVGFTRFLNHTFHPVLFSFLSHFGPPHFLILFRPLPSSLLPRLLGGSCRLCQECLVDRSIAP